MEQEKASVGTPVQSCNQITDFLTGVPNIGRAHIPLEEAYTQMHTYHLAVAALAPGEQGQHHSLEQGSTT